jgi:hypothetical protein
MASTAPATFVNASGVTELDGTLNLSTGTFTGDTTITGALTTTGAVNIGGALNHDGSTAGFFGTAPATKQAVTGALSTVADAPAKAVLTSILAALVAYGLITNSTT